MDRFKKTTVKVRCPRCGGQGKSYSWHSGGQDEHSCPSCGGRGWDRQTLEVLDESEIDDDEGVDQIVQSARRNLEAVNRSLKEAASEKGVTFVSELDDD